MTLTEIYNRVMGYVNSAGIPADAIRIVLLALIGSRLFTLQRRSVRPATGILCGVGSAVILWNFGPFRELLNYAINLLNGYLGPIGMRLPTIL